MHKSVIALFSAILFCSSMELVGMHTHFVGAVRNWRPSYLQYELARSVLDVPVREEEPDRSLKSRKKEPDRRLKRRKPSTSENAKKTLCEGSDFEPWKENKVKTYLKNLKDGCISWSHVKEHFQIPLLEHAQKVEKSDIVLKALFEYVMQKGMSLQDIPVRLRAPLFTYMDEKNPFLALAGDTKQEEVAEVDKKNGATG